MSFQSIYISVFSDLYTRGKLKPKLKKISPVTNYEANPNKQKIVFNQSLDKQYQCDNAKNGAPMQSEYVDGNGMNSATMPYAPNTNARICLEKSLSKDTVAPFIFIIKTDFFQELPLA